MTQDLSPTSLAAQLRSMTAARVAMGRSGSGWPTKATLAFALDHARAREAVWSDMNLCALQEAFAQWPLASVCSAAPDRATYVLRPDLGRRLGEDTDLSHMPKGKIVIVVADGLSATAVDTNAAALVHQLQESLPEVAPVVLVERGRVAVGDDIGAMMQARAVIVLIGERPGLSAADSLGAYVTWAPARGLPDSRRNCISNIRNGGLSPAEAAGKIVRLLAQMDQMQISGVALDMTALAK
jgi:ethanolamine ammonia-lyase small subunit